MQEYYNISYFLQKFYDSLNFNLFISLEFQEFEWNFIDL